MIRLVSIMMGWLLAMTGMAQQETSNAVQSVVYVDIALSQRSQAVKAFTDYAAEIRKHSALAGIELFEQRGRPGHYVLIESWHDQAALDAQAVAQAMLATWLQKLRLSNVDRRPYKALDTAAEKGAGGSGVYVISHVDAAPNQDVAAILQTWVTQSRAEAGNLRFDIVQHQQRGNHYTVIAHWRDDAALQEHEEATHTRRFRDQFGPYAGSPLDERLFDSVQL